MKNRLKKILDIEKTKFFRTYLALLMSILVMNVYCKPNLNDSNFLEFQKTIEGKVVDNGGLPLPGVTVAIKGTSKGTITDFNGEFSIEANSDATLVASFMGFETKEIPLNGSTNITIKMEEDIGKLDDVIVVGYGTVKKSDLTGAVSSVRGEDLTSQSDSNPLTALQGKASGVQVVSSGSPGTSPTVKIRGIGTTGNSDPLYVVDGVFTDNVSYLNNNNIESMEVLKDASATAIYGSRGANGVILITTKKGTSEKPKFQVNFFEGIQKAQPFNLVNAAQYAQLINEGELGQGNPAPYPNPQSLGEGTDWFDAVTRTASVRDYQASFSQKKGNSNYFVSLGLYNNGGVIDKTEYNRYTLRLNNQYGLTDNITVGHNVSVYRTEKGNISDDVTNWLYRVKPTEPVYDENGDFNNVGVNSNGNIVARVFYTNNETKKTGMIGNAYLNIDFLKDFTFKSSIGVDTYRSENTIFNPQYQVGNGNQKNDVNDLTKNWDKRENWLWENTLTYANTFNDHDVNFLAGYTAQENNYEALGGKRNSLFSENEYLWYLDAGSTQGLTNFNYAMSNSITSFLFRANYSYKGKYLFTGTLRSDSSSRFASGNRTGYFPSIALGWRISDESFLNDLDWLSNLKIRGSWGQIGNDKIGDYRYYSLATTSLNNYAIFNDEIQRGSTVQGLVNANITWEISESKNFGFDAGLFNNKLSLGFDYYSRITRDMLVDIGVPATVGLSTTEGNVGSVENKGIDFTVNWRQSFEDFHYNIGLTGSTVNNEVLDLGTEDQIIGGFRASTRTTVGEPIGYFYGYHAIGVLQDQEEINNSATQPNPVPGDLKFEDVNNDGIINADDRTKIGKSIPSFLGSVNLNVGYKNFELTIDMYGSFGADIFNAKELESYSSGDNFTTDYLDRWTGPGTSNTIPRITFGGFNKEFSSRWVESANFWKLQTVRLSYNLPSSFSNKLSIDNFKIYIGGNNLYYFTDYNGPSPEIPGNNALASGIDRNIYPMVSVYKLGASISF